MFPFSYRPQCPCISRPVNNNLPLAFYYRRGRPFSIQPAPPQDTVPSAFEGLICEGQLGQFRCFHGKTLRVESAVYGRQNKYMCWSFKRYRIKQSTNCRRDVTVTLQNLCDDKAVCYIRVTNAAMGGDPCPYTYKYLSVTTRCV
eukprot:superscaffoldBa00004221_g18483